MRSTIRLFMAAILFTALAGVVSAQDPAPPPPAPDVTEPIVLLPLPAAEPNPTAVEPAITADPNAPPVDPALTLGETALTVAPVAPATAEAPAVIEVEKPVVTTTAKRVTKKTAKKPAAVPEIQMNESVKNESLKESAPAASTALADTTANPPAPPAASVEPLKSIAPAPPSVAINNSEETKTVTTMGIGGWLIAGVVVAGLFAGITLFRRRRTLKRKSIVDFTPEAKDLKPVLGPATL